LSKTMVKNMLQPLPVSALFLFSSLALCPFLLTFPVCLICQPVSYSSFTRPLLPVLHAVSAALQPAELVALLQSQSLFFSSFLSLGGPWSSDSFLMTSHLCASACFLSLRGGHLLLCVTWAPGRGTSKSQDRQTPCPPFVH